MQSHRSREGFTLIELLIVIAIIGILSSIVLVTLSNKTDEAKDAKYKFELRQIATIAVLYKTGSDGNGSFTDFCGYSKLQPILKSIGITADCTTDANKNACASDVETSACYSDNNEWVVYTKLSTDKYQCIDHEGTSKDDLVTKVPNTDTNRDCSP